MFRVQFYTNVKVITMALLFALLVGCGGGRATSSESGVATLSWLPPTTYTDGSSISELSGYVIYVDDGSGYTQLATIDNPSVSTYTVEDLPAGTYSFAVTAVDGEGAESDFSNATTVDISS